VAREHLTLLDFSDREFLLLLDDVADGDGYADSLQLADRLDLTKRHSAAQRLSWLARWGAVEREHKRDANGVILYHRDGKAKHTQRWALTDFGKAIAYGKLKAGQRKSLEGLDDSALIEATRLISARTRNGSFAHMAKREWKYGHGIR
jgi:hypothetical protein